MSSYTTYVSGELVMLCSFTSLSSYTTYLPTYMTMTITNVKATHPSDLSTQHTSTHRLELAHVRQRDSSKMMETSTKYCEAMRCQKFISSLKSTSPYQSPGNVVVECVACTLLTLMTRFICNESNITSQTTWICNIIATTICNIIATTIT